MSGWRIGIGVVLALLIGAPVALPFVELWNAEAGWRAWIEHDRLAQLAGNTVRLVAATLAVAVPAGVLGAMLLYRTDLPARRLFRLLVLLTLFVPLPLFASAWQAALGTGGWLPLGAWGTPAADDPDVSATGLTWKPWAVGLPAAAWIHGVAAMPWVVLLVGLGLRAVDPELEEDGLTAAGPGRVLRLVTLPNARLAVAVACLWVVLQAATEITITDMLQVRTLAEEVYYQFVLGDDVALARSVAVALPLAVLLAVPLVWLMTRLERRPPQVKWTAEALVLPLGRMRWPCFVGMLGASAILLGVPLGGLVWKLGLGGQPQTWQVAEAERSLSYVFATRGRVIGESLAWAAGAGGFTALLALCSCWLAVDSRAFRAGLLVLVTLAWALPAPVLGLGLKAASLQAMNAEDVIADSLHVSTPGVARSLLYQDVPFVPIVWTDVLRFFPFAVAFLWPFVRQFPEEWRETARLEGARPAQEFRALVVPLLLLAAAQAALGVTILSLGEVSAGKLAEIPGTKTFAHELFNQMHYGVTSHLAALALILLALVGAGGVLLAGLLRLQGRSRSVGD